MHHAHDTDLDLARLLFKDFNFLIYFFYVKKADAAYNPRTCLKFITFSGFLQYQGKPVIVVCAYVVTLQTGAANIANAAYFFWPK